MNTVFLTISIVFLLIGFVLSIITVRSFFSRNMAEVYDSLLGRGYVEKLERRKNKKNRKIPVNATLSGTMANPMMPDSSPAAAGNAAPAPIPIIGANQSQPPAANQSVNSGNTTVLTNEKVYVGPNNNIEQFDVSSGQTTLLTTQTSDKRLNIVKELYFIASNETLQ